MNALRRRLRVSIIAWMVFQVVSLAALVPKDCCQSHQAAARPGGNCHEPPDAAYCPMRSQGRVCPMHQAPQASAQADHSHHGAAEHEAPPPAAHDHEPVPADDCRLGSVCNVPAAALAAILSNHGLLPGRLLMPANPGLAAAALVPDVRLVGCLIAPDNPPPRA